MASVIYTASQEMKAELRRCGRSTENGEILGVSR